MSKFNKRASLIAAAVALALPGAALAVDAGYPNGDTLTYASNVVNANTESLTIAGGATFSITANDNLAGRTTGFGVRIRLANASFASVPEVTIADDQAGTVYTGQAVVPGTEAGSTVMLYSVGVNAGGPGITGMRIGDVLAIGDFEVDDLTGAPATAAIEIYDPATNEVLAASMPYRLFNTQEAVSLTFSQSLSDAVAKRIDVVEGDTYEARTGFSPDGSLGGADAAGEPEAEYFNAGGLTLAVSTYGEDDTPVYDVDASAFEFTDLDLLTYTVTSTADLESFESIFLSDSPTCSIDAAGPYIGQVDGNVVTFEGIPAAEMAGFTPAGPEGVPAGTQFLCFETDGDTMIEAQSFTATASVDFDDEDVTDWSSAAVVQNPLPMRYNGSVIQLFNVNPASNTTQESLLRYTNNSSQAYRVSLRGRDDSGEWADGTFSFNLPAGASISLRSVEIENGSAKGTGSLGAGEGKWVIEATAEGTGLVASGLNRSALTGVISELNGEKHTDPADGTRVRTTNEFLD